MELVSITKFAGISGVTKQAVSKAVSNGLLRKTDPGRSGKIDLDDPLTRNYLNHDTVNRRKSKATPASTPEHKQDKEYHRTTTANYPPSALDEKTKAQTIDLHIKIAQKMKKLILLSKVDNAFSILYRLIRDKLLGNTTDLSKRICFAIGVTDKEKASIIIDVLNLEYTKTIEDIKRCAEGELNE